MSSVPTRLQPFFGRLRRSKSVFFMFAAVGALLVVCCLGYLRYQLQTADAGRAERLVAEYIEKGGLRQVQDASSGAAFSDLNDLAGLAFVRFVRGNEHILLADEKLLPLELDELIHIDRTSAGTWCLFGGSDRAFTLVVKPINTLLWLQAAVVAENYLLYTHVVHGVLVGFALYLFVAVFVTVAINRQSYASLDETCLQIGAMVTNSSLISLSETGNEPEIDRLNCQINSLVVHNRTLVSTIQASLDNVAHDLRTPVTRLRSVAEYGLQSEEVGKLRCALADCLEESEQITAMLRIMMSVAEAESGTMNLHQKVSDISVGIQDAIELYEYVAEEKEIAVDIDSPVDMYANIDPVRMRQVWANLLDNAIKYGTVGGYVTVQLLRDADMILVRFKDNGIGVSESEQHRIWERLYRGDRSRSEKGLGLGLNYVKAVVEAHGGRVSVSSILHQGSVFEICLPASQLAAEDYS